MEALEPFQHAHQLLLLRQYGEAQMEGSCALPEAVARHGDDAQVLQQLECIQCVWLLSLAFRVRNELRRQIDLREGVHGSLYRHALHARDLVQLVEDELSLLFQSGQNRVLLPCEEHHRGVPCICQISLAVGRVCHRGHHCLPDRVRAQSHGKELVKLLVHALVDVVQVHVAAPQAALPIVTLGDRMEGEELCLRPQLVQDLAKTEEGLLLDRTVPCTCGILVVNVFLVDLICQNREILLLRQLHDVLNGRLREHVPSRVARVDHRDAAHPVSQSALLRNRGAELLHVHLPSEIPQLALRQRRGVVGRALLFAGHPV
mmetsp:Transcript_31435/g.83722  ORF Transcript_31435/g.83722 Transcript_31435/m.83722 type:complete len:317 (-) Transcript_31435:766-1716(-)